MKTIITSICFLLLIRGYSSEFLTQKNIPKIDPDYNKPLEQIVTSRGYPLETHYVTTKDGYILKLFRIPGKKNSTEVNSKPCLLMHGLLVNYSFNLGLS